MTISQPEFMSRRVGLATPRLTSANVLAYLQSIHLAGPDAKLLEFHELAGGFLNHVFRANIGTAAGEVSYLLKQAVHHVPRDESITAEYASDPDRLTKSAQAIQWFRSLTHDLDALPILHNMDSTNRIKVIDYFPDTHLVVQDLVVGHLDVVIGQTIIRALSEMHNATAHHAELARTYDNRQQFWTRTRLQCFDITAEPSLRERIVAFYATSEAYRLCLNYGDIDHKNILVNPEGRIRFIDFEEAHYTNPAIDLAYLAASYYLGALHDLADKPTILPQCQMLMNELWETYFSESVFSPVEQARIQLDFPHHVLIFMLGRIDGRATYRFATHHQIRRGMRTLIDEHFMKEIPTLADLHTILSEYLA
ncbi:MAG: phosphotransferase [Caldilineaceae bacterium]